MVTPSFIVKVIYIISNLNNYVQLASTLQRQESTYLQTDKNFIALSYSVSSAYNSITIELNQITQDDDYGNLYIKILFELEKDLVVLKEVYCVDKARKPFIETLVVADQNANKNQWKPNSLRDDLPYDSTIMRYLSVADNIALRAMNCASGDDYYPGAFSKVMITDKNIILSQINHMNAKSLDHNDNYSLRDLEFFIPVTTLKDDTNRHDYTIGDMLINFSDRSSKNNKTCGDAILEQIRLEKAAW
jgi:hypothetical protein